jgi:hypothetical protein
MDWRIWEAFYCCFLDSNIHTSTIFPSILATVCAYLRWVRLYIISLRYMSISFVFHFYDYSLIIVIGYFLISLNFLLKSIGWTEERMQGIEKWMHVLAWSVSIPYVFIFVFQNDQSQIISLVALSCQGCFIIVCTVIINVKYPFSSSFPCSLFPVPCSLFPVPCSLFPVPCSLFPVPCSLFPVPCSLFPVPCSLFFPFTLSPLPSASLRPSFYSILFGFFFYY